MTDSYTDSVFRQRRIKLVQEVKNMLPSLSPKVEMAMLQVPRQDFMDRNLLAFSYENKAYPIECGQTISQPIMVAQQTSLLDVEPSSVVLEIGTGSGYQTAILCELARFVYTVERQEVLFERARNIFLNKPYRNVKFSFSDGTLGLPQAAPFDRIIVTAGAQVVPKPLVQQLKINGKMVIPVGPNGNMHLYVITRLSEKEFRSEQKELCAFVPLLAGTERKLRTY